MSFPSIQNSRNHFQLVEKNKPSIFIILATANLWLLTCSNTAALSEY